MPTVLLVEDEFDGIADLIEAVLEDEGYRILIAVNGKQGLEMLAQERPLKENLLWVRTFETIEKLLQALLAFRNTDNTTWLIERHGFITPEAFRNNQR